MDLAFYVGFCHENAEAIRQERVRHPKIAMRPVFEVIGHGQGADIVEYHGRIACEPFVFRRDLSGAICKTPRRIGKDTAKPVFAQKVSKVL